MPKVIALDSLAEIAVCDCRESLLDALRLCALDILSNIVRMAAILRRLESLGMECEIDHDLLPYIRLIAHGKLSANCFVTCAADPLLLKQAMRLPMPIQEQIGNNEPFTVIDPSGAKRQVHPLDMSRKELLQLFSGGKPRDEEEQAEYLQKETSKAVRRWPKRDRPPARREAPRQIPEPEPEEEQDDGDVLIRRCIGCKAPVVDGFDECPDCRAGDRPAPVPVKRAIGRPLVSESLVAYCAGELTARLDEPRPLSAFEHDHLSRLFALLETHLDVEAVK